VEAAATTLRDHPLLPTYIDLRPTCRLARLHCLPVYASARKSPPVGPLSRRAPSANRRKLCCLEISIKRNSVRASIRLNLPSYSPRERKETFWARRTACPGFEMTRDLPCSLVTLPPPSPLLAPAFRLFPFLFLSLSLSLFLSLARLHLHVSPSDPRVERRLRRSLPAN